MPKNVCDEVVHGELLIDAPRGPMSEFYLSFPRMSFLTIRGIRLFSHATPPHLAFRKSSQHYYIFIRSLVFPCRERGTEVLQSLAPRGGCPIGGVARVPSTGSDLDQRRRSLTGWGQVTSEVMGDRGRVQTLIPVLLPVHSQFWSQFCIPQGLT